MKKMSMLLLILISGFLFAGEEVIPMPEVVSPYGIIEFYQDYMYIPQKHNVQIYSRKDFSLIKEFSRKGEGPGEFKFMPRIKVYDQHIMMQDVAKVMFFTHLGELKEEIKKPIQVAVEEPVPEGYLGRYNDVDRDTREFKRGFYIFSPKFEDKRLMMEYIDDSMKFNPTARALTMKVPHESVDAKLYKNRIYIGNVKRGVFFEVFDLKGNKLYEFSYPYEREKISNSYKEAFIKHRESFTKKSTIKTKYDFLSHFPAFARFLIKEDHIEIFPFSPEFKAKTHEIIYLDLKGNFIKTIKKDIQQKDDNIKPRRIGARGHYQGKKYDLIENEEEEIWELHIEEIKEKK